MTSQGKRNKHQRLSFRLGVWILRCTYIKYILFSPPFSAACLSTSVRPAHTAVLVPKQEDGTKSDTRKRGQKKQPKLERRPKPRTSPNNLSNQYNSNSHQPPLLVSSLGIVRIIQTDILNSTLVNLNSRNKLPAVPYIPIRIMFVLHHKWLKTTHLYNTIQCNLLLPGNKYKRNNRKGGLIRRLRVKC